MREKNESKSEKPGLLEGPGADERSRGPDLRLAAEFTAVAVLPLGGPLSLCINPPDSDVGKIFAFLGWPLLYFLGGLFASYFDQPSDRDSRSDEALTKLKWTARNLRVGWLLFLLLFEGLTAMWILAEYPQILLTFVLLIYATYALLAVYWLVCHKRIRESAEHRAQKEMS